MLALELFFPRAVGTFRAMSTLRLESLFSELRSDANSPTFTTLQFFQRLERALRARKARQVLSDHGIAGVDHVKNRAAFDFGGLHQVRAC